MSYFLFFVFLLAVELVYFKIARRYGIVDKPNTRSSHKGTPIRGAGILFWIAGICYMAIHFPKNLYFLIGLTLICLVSFWDDIVSLKNRVRTLCHFSGISLLFVDIQAFACLPSWTILVAMIVCVGIINTFNFMDGINGMVGLYYLIFLLCLQYINLQLLSFVCPDFIWFAIIPNLIFLYFNFRKRAVCFLGDIGSMSIALWAVYLLIQLMITTDSLVWILFFAVFGVETVGTIVYRIILKKNIFKAHRMFFFQILSNEMQFSQLFVSSIYSSIQLIINIIIIFVWFEYQSTVNVVSIVLLVLLCCAWLFRFHGVIKRKLKYTSMIT
ncbi:MAG: UDP-GlcNAc--UDP-phosphate GlcNAc-1-phosphate transferase [Dysgonamonadaceae bacterium]|jgi:UDP-N-acetylmuramyl pentapeptide phosphotransferase/UDP-N-acetylglucosamine-1-phosphate transferase|nr:UDP-GlcNAc--UDP-phosphate GlcNAc-1-phosphate transferase [Dysgonamonadaceae bacterium]